MGVAKRLHGRGFVEVEVSLFSEREFLIDDLLVRIHSIIEIIRWTGLAPWESVDSVDRPRAMAEGLHGRGFVEVEVSCHTRC